MASEQRLRAPWGSSLGPATCEDRSSRPQPSLQMGGHFGSLDSKVLAPPPAHENWETSSLPPGLEPLRALPLPLRNSTEAASFLLLRKKHFVLVSSPLRDWGSLFPGTGSGCRPPRGLVSASP